MSKINLKFIFEQFYQNAFKQSDMYTAMVETVEGSHWHREENVGVHTDMVVAEYIKRSPKQWERVDVLGALACAFHDVGKPVVQEMKNNEARGDYFTYKGHEQASARLFEDFGIDLIGRDAFGFYVDNMDIAKVCWMIQNHLPYRIKKLPKLQGIKATIQHFELDRVFQRVLLSDQYGRISDDQDTNKLALHEWISKLNDIDVPKIDNNVGSFPDFDKKPTVRILIGPSSAGKSTYMKEYMENHGNIEVYSLDELRLNWYTDPNDDWATPADRYGQAFKIACDDSEFQPNAQRAYIDLLKTGKDIIVDNTNLTTKSRRFVCSEAMNKGYHITCVVFQVKREELLRRGLDRDDRTIPKSILINMHDRLTYPTLVTECHSIFVRTT